MTIEHVVDERADLILFADVARDRFAASVVGRRSGLVEGLLAAPADHHLRAERGQLECRGSAQS